ncbi:hypothetical protein GGX14DRAFT_592313 [Mycena pura]|uniref:Transmembrane protein n=1 Tax=Mycena pura TaxID=153505 RepID=A0AAD6VT16_9AGAR|nr:hypothetical protein GGX14DRAFT_592313 [Mycena pura]
MASDPPSYSDRVNVPSRQVLSAAMPEEKRYVGPQSLSLPSIHCPQRPLTLRNSVVALICTTLVGLAVVLEVTLVISTKNDGFPTPTHNVFSGFSPRFLTAFFPTVLVAGLVLTWQSSDRSYRELQPYIVLARGGVTAAEGLLANYARLGYYGIVVNAIKFRHYLILLSALTTLLANVLQPLAGSVIQFEQLPQTNAFFVQSTKTIGLAPDEAQLNAFLAAAGYAEAAVFHSLPDPPFIYDGWSVAELDFPPAVLNGTLTVNTTAIRSAPNCQTGESSTLNVPGSNNITIQATNNAGCSGTVTFTQQASGTQYGVVPATGCGTGSSVEFLPVMFWFFHDDNGQPEGATVFCSPSIEAFNVEAYIDLNNNSIVGITALSNVQTSNNVTGSPLNGQAFNSVVFLPNNDTFVQARAVSIGSSVAGAIFRFASQLPGGVQPTFDDPNGFLSLTEKVFTQHLSISAKSIYFIGGTSGLLASLTSLAPRLVIDPLPAHALAVVLLLIAFSALFIHIVHSRQRRRFYLAASPGSVAHIMSMTAHSRIGETLYPYDDDETLARKLAGLSFSLDPRTGALVSDRDVGAGNAVPVRQVVPYTVTLAETRPYTRVYTSPPTVQGYAELAEPLFPLADEKRGTTGWRQSSMAAFDDMPPRDRASGSSTAFGGSDTGDTALPASWADERGGERRRVSSIPAAPPF